MARPRTSIVTSVVLTTVWACSSSTGDGPAPTCGPTEIIAAASDTTSSVVCGAPPCELGPYTSGAALGTDPSLVASNGRVFYIARDNDNIFELDAVCGIPRAQFSVHQEGIKRANAHDVAAARDGSLFVVLYDVPRIVVIRDETKKPDGAPIDLSTYDDDGNPQAESIRIVEVAGVEKAFVTLERLDNLDLRHPKKPSQMLRIDVATRQVEAFIELAGRNPFNSMVELNGALFLAEPGNFDADDEPLAGIERFDTATSTTRLLVNEKELGGSVAELAVTEGCGVAIVAGKQKDVNPTSVVTFDPATGRVLRSASDPLLATGGYDLQALAWKGSTLYVGDRRTGGVGFKVHAFERDPGTCNLHETGKAITLPQRPIAIRAAR